MAEISTGINKSKQFNKTLEQGVEGAVREYGKGKDYFSVKQALDKDITLEEDENEEEMEEATMTGGSSGSYESPLPGMTPKSSRKRKKSNIPNWDSTTISEAKKKCPKGQYYCSVDKICKPESQRKNKEEEMGEQTGSGSSGAYSQPAIWAKNKSNWRAVSDPNFPKFGGPGGTYVKIKNKCRHFPYCNQGDINALEFYESTELMESIMRVAKKKGRETSYVLNIVKEAMKDSNLGKKLRNKADKKAKDSEKKNKRYTKEEIEEMITRPFYHSQVTNPKAGIVGVMPMDLPIGKMYTMKGNKPKYEK